MKDFQEDGFTVIPDFASQAELDELRTGLLNLIEKKMCSLDASFCLKDSQHAYDLDWNLNELRTMSPLFGSQVYAAAKKLPQFVRFAASLKNENLARELIGSKHVAFSDRGWGLRIDYPRDQKFATPLHQDYHTQIGSMDGIVIWVPLTDVTFDMGPLIFWPKSHKLGVLPVRQTTLNSGSTDLAIEIDSGTLERFQRTQIEVRAGTAVVINFLTLHQSGFNQSTRNRFSLLSRWFNFDSAAAIERGWHGGIQDGHSFGSVHPDLVRSS